MLPKSLRLKLDADFSRVYRKGYKTHSRSFVVTTAPNTLSHPRFACVVPKTVSKKAVVRNKIRRLVHEVIASELKTNTKLAASSFDIMVSAKKGSEALTYTTVMSELQQPLRGVGTKNVSQGKTWSKK